MADNNLSGRRILVVEDEMIIAMLLEDMLADLGCEVIGVASRVAMALAMIENGTPFDAAVLDVNLNGEKSYPVAAALAARGVPFAFSTGYDGRGMDREYSRIPVVQKPYCKADVERTLLDLLIANAGCGKWAAAS